MEKKLSLKEQKDYPYGDLPENIIKKCKIPAKDSNRIRIWIRRFRNFDLTRALLWKYEEPYWIAEMENKK